jgi:hypothetical protein
VEVKPRGHAVQHEAPAQFAMLANVAVNPFETERVNRARLTGTAFLKISQLKRSRFWQTPRQFIVCSE